jgi:hypothetical protein
MRCECCNKMLSDKEATARFAPTEKGEAPRYVNMCTECQGFLPPSVKILTRADLPDSQEGEKQEFGDYYDKYVDDFFLSQGDNDE